jgi:hypothetical protein
MLLLLLSQACSLRDQDYLWSKWKEPGQEPGKKFHNSFMSGLTLVNASVW